jgi:hypothetical protein
MKGSALGGTGLEEAGLHESKVGGFVDLSVCSSAPTSMCARNS